MDGTMTFRMCSFRIGFQDNLNYKVSRKLSDWIKKHISQRTISIN
jgi:hypothetical protein